MKEIEKMILLDVGSGLTCSSPLLTSKSEIIHLDILKNCQHQEVQATVYALPFPSNCFEVVYASHLIEHLDNPLAALQELKRVCKSIVVIRVPNELYTNQFLGNMCSQEHLFSWTANTLKNLLEKVFSKVKIETVHRIAKRTETNILKRKLQTLKTYVIALFFYRQIENEIVAYCRVKTK
jgi:ubiquinone/menaquinone biosynthesis C-methylase UbiE